MRATFTFQSSLLCSSLLSSSFFLHSRVRLLYLSVTPAAYTSLSVTAAAPWELDWTEADAKAELGSEDDKAIHLRDKAMVEEAKTLGGCIAHGYTLYLTYHFAYSCSQSATRKNA